MESLGRVARRIEIGQRDQQIGPPELWIIQRGAVVHGDQHLPIPLRQRGADARVERVKRAQRDQLSPDYSYPRR